MEKIFDLISVPEAGSGESREIRIGIRVNVAGHETLCPLSGSCRSYEEFEAEIEAVKGDLDDLLNRAGRIFRNDAAGDGLGLTPEMDAAQIWTVLSQLEKDGAFIEGFNQLEEAKRREVAEYVLTHCNIFSGRAAFFSAHFDQDSGIMQ